ncbi:hypothetical protein [Parapedobacter sp. 10938]|uniref:hypothetical protein n=1 Tax=Parapedobacter flavus TaxID=3110225 RepID=UPI002DBD7D5C|nr:hypothetical protein [Parapedobacter sp. 10938]MEC3878309.1 hypothetical protein [Parapedobacter sp. 10938]
MQYIIISWLRITLLFAVTALMSTPVFSQPGDSLIPPHPSADLVSVSTFDVDATPPVGSYLTYDVMTHTWDMGLRARGVVISGAGDPIVLCSVDWIGIANEGQDEFKRVLALAAGTTPDRVAVHTVHQHDAPTCDFGAEALLLSKGLDPINYEGTFARQVLKRLERAVQQAMEHPQRVTHVGLGSSFVHQVASNRRILDEHGKATISRTSATARADIRAYPEGIIDPEVSLISFWDEDKPVAVLSYYACHPQSYYRTGTANPDFPGIARFMRQMAVPEALHVHFNGAGGDITAGKYNDGSKANRLELAKRLAAGMERAWENTERSPLTPSDIGWASTPLKLPIAQTAIALEDELADHNPIFLANNVYKLVLAKRQERGLFIPLSCLKLGRARILHLPGEPLVAFQLAAKKMREDLFVAVAGYGDYGPGYICPASAYEEGGYEAGPASGVTPEAEKVMMAAMEKLLKD